MSSEQGVAVEKESILFDPDVQALMQQMVDQGVYAMIPKIDAKGISYPTIAAAFPNKTEAEVRELLQKLAHGGIFNSKLVDKVIACPTCGSPSVYSKYNCPRCNSFNIGKASIIEHVRCGYIGSKERFSKESQLICPKCKGLVSEIDYRNIGTSFECNACGSRFEAPRMIHKCNSCEDIFTYREAKYESIFEYYLSEDTKRSIAKGAVPLGSIANALRENGFEVGIKADLQGKSGATHTFDIVARNATELIVANFTFEPKEEDIIGLFAKKYDIDPTYTLLIALTTPSKEQEAVSKAYGVRILSSTGLTSIAERILRMVDKSHPRVEEDLDDAVHMERAYAAPQVDVHSLHDRNTNLEDVHTASKKAEKVKAQKYRLVIQGALSNKIVSKVVYTSREEAEKAKAEEEKKLESTGRNVLFKVITEPA